MRNLSSFCQQCLALLTQEGLVISQQVLMHCTACLAVIREGCAGQCGYRIAVELSELKTGLKVAVGRQGVSYSARSVDRLEGGSQRV